MSEIVPRIRTYRRARRPPEDGIEAVKGIGRDSQHDAAEIPVHNRSMKRDNGGGRVAPINADKQQAARRADADLQERFP